MSLITAYQWSPIAELPTEPRSLGEHLAVSRSPPLVKHLQPRDRVETVPLSVTDEEAALLVRQYENHEHTSSGWDGQDIWSGSRHSLRGEPRDLKILAMRLLWFGWLHGHDWQRVGPPTPLGKALLRAWLCEQEGRGDPKATHRRRRWFPTDAEVAQIKAERARRAALEEAAYQRRVARDERADLHRARLHAAEFAWSQHCLKMGRGEINDIDGAMDTLRTLTRTLDAERAWTWNDEG